MNDRQRFAEAMELRTGISQNEGESIDDYLARVNKLMNSAPSEATMAEVMQTLSQWNR